MRLYSYFRSTAAYRVRIALELKGIAHEIVPVNLSSGEQRSRHFLNENPQGLVPALKLDCGTVIAQSTAILEWLEERFPETPLYSQDLLARAQQRALCQHIACDIHPLNNLRVLRYLGDTLEQPQDRINDWYTHWVQQGFIALEDAVKKQTGEFSLGKSPGMLEVFLVPQLFNARRFNIDLSPFPAIRALDTLCQNLSAFAKAHPVAQIDAPAEPRR